MLDFQPISSKPGTRCHTSPHSDFHGFLWYVHNIAPSLRRSARIPKLTKPALLDGAAKRDAKLLSHRARAARFPKRVLSLDPPRAAAPFVPGAHAAGALVPSQRLNSPPAPSFGSDLITYLFALSYSELLWNDNLLRTEVFLPPCQHSVESLPLTPAAPPARSLSKRSFPFGLCSAWSGVDFACTVYFVFTHACFSFPPLHLSFHPIIYRVGIVSVFRNGL